MSESPPLPSASAAAGPAIPSAGTGHKPRRLAGDRGPAPIVALAWATFFGAGYFPVAPGTAGTAAAVPLWWALSAAPRWAYLAAAAAVTLTGMAAAQRAGRYFGVADSGHIVIDEVAGYLVTMAFLPREALPAIAAILTGPTPRCPSARQPPALTPA